MRLATNRIQIEPCTVADSRMQHNKNKINGTLPATGGHAGTICMRLVATRVQFKCDWPPRMLFLHATGGHPDTICLHIISLPSTYVR